MNKVTVSIVMPVFNESLYLKECIKSIIAQKETNWELIAVDDFSTDDSWAILQAYSTQDIRIRVFKNSTKGIIPALQHAYSKSTGRFITRMDADDIMTPDRLSAMILALKNNSEQYIAVGLVQYFSLVGISDGYANYEQWLNQLTTDSSNFEDIYKECVIPSPCWMTSRKNFELCGGFNSVLYPEDYDLAFRFYVNDCPIIGVPYILHKWRDYPTRSSRVDPHYSDNRFLDLKLHYFLKKDWNQKEIVIWGAGKKGKYIAGLLREREISFEWICNNWNKIGKEIYGVKLKDSSHFTPPPTAQFILAVASKNTQSLIEDQLIHLRRKKNIHYFWFC